MPLTDRRFLKRNTLVAVSDLLKQNEADLLGCPYSNTCSSNYLADRYSFISDINDPRMLNRFLCAMAVISFVYKGGRLRQSASPQTSLQTDSKLRETARTKNQINIVRFSESYTRY